MRLPVYLWVLTIGCIWFCTVLAQEQLEPRESFSISLAKLSVSFNDETHAFQKVKVSYENDQGYATIGRSDDLLIKVTSSGQEKSIFSENSDLAYLISSFEAKTLDKIVKTFVQTLKQFEDALHHKKWGRCLYLDAYFPRFLRGFYFVYSASRNSITAMPPSARVADSLYEISINSIQSDARIKKWRSHDENIIKLRISTKELIFQLEQWQKKELANPGKYTEVSGNTTLENAFALFIRTYFGTKISARERQGAI